MSLVEAEPVTTCGACRQADDHPKHTVLVGFNNPATGGALFHPDDDDRDGAVHYHFDCPSKWHAAPGVDAEHHARLAELARSGVKGDALRARIVEGET